MDETFKPFLWALTAKSRPSPIFAVAYTGVAYWLKTEVPEDAFGKTLSEQIPYVIQAIISNQKERNGSPFGLHTGYVFIRRLDEFHEFDIQGHYIGIYTKRIPHMTSIVRLDAG